MGDGRESRFGMENACIVRVGFCAWLLYVILVIWLCDFTSVIRCKLVGSMILNFSG